MRLIDDNVLLEYIEKKYCEPCMKESGYRGCPTCLIEDVRYKIDNAPTIDAIPAVLCDKKMKKTIDLIKVLNSIISYNGHAEWLLDLANKMEKNEHMSFEDCEDKEMKEFHTEKHMFWMIFVGLFGDWGTSIRCGWIENTTECATFIRWICNYESLL